MKKATTGQGVAGGAARASAIKIIAYCPPRCCSFGADAAVHHDY